MTYTQAERSENNKTRWRMVMSEYDAALHFFGGFEGMLKEMVDPFPCERMAEQPEGVVNHPAWTIGHLATGIDMVLGMMGAETVCPAGWQATYAPGKPPVNDRGVFAKKDELLDRYSAAHAAMTAAVKGADASVLAAEMPVEDYRSFFPTVGHAAMYMLASHEPAHIGQIAVWRRAAGLLPGDG